MPFLSPTAEDQITRFSTWRIPLLWIWLAWAIPALLSGIDTYMQSRLSGESADWRWLVFNTLDWLIYAVLTPFVFRFSRRFSLVSVKWKTRSCLHILAALALCIAWAGMGTVIRWIIFPPPSNSTYLHGFISWIFTTLPFGVGVYFALVGIEHSLFYFQQARAREMLAAQLSSQLSEARLSALQMQLNPHFLFNSLNAITVLVRDQETARASKMLELLSEVLREVLRTDVAHERILEKEVDFLERYLAIEQIRFSDRLRPRLLIDSETNKALVPVFLLQPLVENAVRHGIAVHAEAGLIEIAAKREGDDLVLTVRDDGAQQPSTAGHRSTSPGTGIGLTNIRTRLQTLYGGAASLEAGYREEGGFLALVRLPYRRGDEQE